LHCDSEKRVREILSRLTQDPDCFHSFLNSYAKRSSCRSKQDDDSTRVRWSRFLELACLDPYTPERLRLSRRGQDSLWCRNWVESAVEVCKRHDAEFNLALEERMVEHFKLAAALLQNEERPGDHT